MGRLAVLKTITVIALVVGLLGCQATKHGQMSEKMVAKSPENLKASAPLGNAIPDERIGIVLMHGKGGTTRHVDDLSDNLKDLGVLVETPIMPWSEDRIYDKGYEESMAEIDTYVKKLEADGAKKIFVAGHSLGANAALGYGARREGLSGVILLAYGHVPGLRGFARKLKPSTDKAQAMINAGKGEEKASFDDVSGGRKKTAYSTANDLFSWFDPDGLATIAANAPKVKSNTPVLCVDGSYDRWQRCERIMSQLPDNPKSKALFVNADHRETPAQAFEEIETWLRGL